MLCDSVPCTRRHGATSSAQKPSARGHRAEGSSSQHTTVLAEDEALPDHAEKEVGEAIHQYVLQELLPLEALHDSNHSFDLVGFRWRVATQTIQRKKSGTLLVHSKAGALDRAWQAHTKEHRQCVVMLSR